MYLVHTPKLIQQLLPGFTWRKPSAQKVLYLTFDDGPIPEVTPWVMEQLRRYDARGTFFCVGHNVQKHPEVFDQLLEEGHAVGNHTFHHLDGWNTDTKVYVDNVAACATWVDSNLFRPPYGKLTPAKTQQLRPEYEVVLWDVLSADFDTRLTGEQCWQNVQRNARPGSILVFHDSLKAWDRLSYALPKTLAYFADQGYRFEALQSQRQPVREWVPVMA